MATIPILGLAAGDYVPGVYAYVSWAAGNPVGVGGIDKILIIANGTSAGTGTRDTVIYGPDTTVQMAGEADCITLAGAGSPAHRMYRRISRVNPTTPIYMLLVTESVGTAGSKRFVFQGPATAAGTARIWVGDEFVEVPFLSGDTASTIAGAADDIINAKTHWAMTAAATNAELLFTAKCKGPRSNRLRVRIDLLPPTGAGVSVFTPDYKTTIAAGSDGAALAQATINVADTTGFPSSGTIYVTTSATTLQAVTYSGKTGTTFTGCSGGTGTMSTGGAVYSAASGHDYLTSGATADSSATALTTLAGKHYYYIVSEANDSTQFGALSTLLTTEHLPVKGNRMRASCGWNDTSANGITFATAINNPLCDITILPDSDAPPEELAAAAVAIYALEEAGDRPRMNFNNYGSQPEEQGLWTIKAPLNGSVPTRAQIASWLNNGLSPVMPVEGGRTVLLAAITTLSLINSQNNYAVRPRSKVTVTHKYTAELVARVATAAAGKNIANDPVGQEPIPPDVVTPKDLEVIANDLTTDYADNRGRLDFKDEIIAATRAVRESDPTDRLSLTVPLHVRDILNQVGVSVAQTTP